MEYNYGNIFTKEFKKLCKKYKSLNVDFDTFLLNLENDPTGENILERSIERITIKEEIQYFKVRKFICQSINRNSSNSGLRIIYSYSKDKIISFEEIEFIEIYHKNDRANHDDGRLG